MNNRISFYNKFFKRYECKDDTPKTKVLLNDLEEVLYSDGEGVPDPYPNNTWDSEEEIVGDEYSLTSH